MRRRWSWLGVVVLFAVSCGGDGSEGSFRSDGEAEGRASENDEGDVATQVEEAYAGIDVVVVPRAALSSYSSLVESVAFIDGVAAVDASYAAVMNVHRPDGTPEDGFQTLAMRWISDERLNVYTIVEGRAPEAPDEVAIDEGLAREGGFEIRDTVVIGPDEFTVTGVAALAYQDSGCDVPLAVFTWSGVLPDWMAFTESSSIIVSGEVGVSQGELVDRVRPVVQGDAESVVTGEEVIADTLERCG